MTYTQTDWVDGVTPVNAANLDHIEAGIYAAHAGLPPQPYVEGYWLKVQGGVMVWAPAPAGGGGTDWEGAWAAGTPYVKGDVVTYQGVTYVAVNDGTGQTPPAASPVYPSFTPISLVTSLPASPFDGQEIILVDSLTVPTYAWRLRYVAAKASNKWIFIGGSPLSVELAALATYTAATYGDPASVGPSVTVPVAGQYLIEHLARSANTAATSGSQVRYVAAKLGAAAAADTEASEAGDNATTSQPNMQSWSGIRVLAAGDVVKLQYRLAVATGTGNFSKRWLAVTPVAVGG